MVVRAIIRRRTSRMILTDPRRGVGVQLGSLYYRRTLAADRDEQRSCHCCGSLPLSFNAVTNAAIKACDPRTESPTVSSKTRGVAPTVPTRSCVPGSAVPPLILTVSLRRKPPRWTRSGMVPRTPTAIRRGWPGARHGLRCPCRPSPVLDCNGSLQVLDPPGSHASTGTRSRSRRSSPIWPLRSTNSKRRDRH